MNRGLSLVFVVLGVGIIVSSCSEPHPVGLHIKADNFEVTINGERVLPTGLFRNDRFTRHEFKKHTGLVESWIDSLARVTGKPVGDIPVFLELSDSVTALTFTNVSEWVCRGAEGPVSLVFQSGSTAVDTLALISELDKVYRKQVQIIPFGRYELSGRYAIRTNMFITNDWMALWGPGSWLVGWTFDESPDTNYTRFFDGLIESFEELNYRHEWDLTTIYCPEFRFGDAKPMLSKIARSLRGRSIRTFIVLSLPEFMCNPGPIKEEVIDIKNAAELLRLENVLDVAIATGDEKCAAECLARGVDPNMYSRFGSTDSESLLMQAAEKGRADLVGLLLDYGADPNALNVRKKSVFDYAMEDPDRDVWLELLKAKPNPELVRIALKNRAIPEAIDSLVAAYLKEDR